MMAEILISYYRESGIERWMWECPCCQKQSSIHVNGNYNPDGLTCSKCQYRITTLDPLSDHFEMYYRRPECSIDDVPVYFECEIISRWALIGP